MGELLKKNQNSEISFKPFLLWLFASLTVHFTRGIDLTRRKRHLCWIGESRRDLKGGYLFRYDPETSPFRSCQALLPRVVHLTCCQCRRDGVEEPVPFGCGVKCWRLHRSYISLGMVHCTIVDLPPSSQTRHRLASCFWSCRARTHLHVCLAFSSTDELTRSSMISKNCRNPRARLIRPGRLFEE